MGRTITPLNAKKVKEAKPKDKKYKLTDGRGLFLLIKPNGSKLWRLKYRFNNKEKEYAIGVYPQISLAKARKERERLKELIANGIDPSEQKKQDKQKIKEIEAKKENTFYNISQKWLQNYKGQVSESYHRRIGNDFERYLYKTYNDVNIKNKPIDEITRLDIVTILEALKDKGLDETARRVKQKLNQIFMYAVTHEYTPHNIIADIDTKSILGKKKKKSYPAFTKEKDIKGLLLAIDEYQGNNYYTRMALKVLPYLFVRSFNIRHMEWKEINFKTKEWTIPANKMKMKKEFILPLPQQVITLLNELKENKLSDKYVFPSPIYKDRPLSENTLTTALRRMGYTKDEIVPHGFRAMFKTITEEHDKQDKVIKALLAHKIGNEVERAYNRAEYKKQKRELIQWYADYLDEVKNGSI